MYYSDGIHLICDSKHLKDLHDYAQSIGIKRCWYHKSRFPHYDIPKKRRQTFFQDHPEVKKITAREIVFIMKKNQLIFI